MATGAGKQLVTWHLQSGSRERLMLLFQVAFSSLLIHGPQPRGWTPPASRVAFLCQLKLSAVSLAILNSAACLSRGRIASPLIVNLASKHITLSFIFITFRLCVCVCVTGECVLWHTLGG